MPKTVLYSQLTDSFNYNALIWFHLEPVTHHFKLKTQEAVSLDTGFFIKYTNTMPQIGSINNNNIETYVVGNVIKVFAALSYFCTV